MRKKADTGILAYGLADYLAASLAWFSFFIFRKVRIEDLEFSTQELMADRRFLYGMLVIPVFWMGFYFFQNTYQHPVKKSRLAELFRTFLQTLIGGVILFFTLMLNDIIRGYQDYYYLFFAFLLLHFCFTASFRMIVLTWIHRRIDSGKLYIPTLLYGTAEHCDHIRQEIEQSKIRLPYKITDQFTIAANEITYPANGDNYEEVIVTPLPASIPETEQVIIHFLNKGKTVQVLPDELDILAGKFRTQSIFGSPLIEIPTDVLQPWQKISKRLADIIVATMGLIFISPLLALIAWKVKRSSTGPVFFLQDRVGRNGQLFRIIKFRSMVVNAENGIPQLSSEDDPRITPFGKFLRKYRLDELPQLWNVLRGDMSLVGPRPERKYFIDQIIRTAPQYQLLQRVRPGITSLGMVKYGYASNLEEMLQRMRYDLLYLENMSLLLDIKILIYTVIILWKGKGK